MAVMGSSAGGDGRLGGAVMAVMGSSAGGDGGDGQLGGDGRRGGRGDADSMSHNCDVSISQRLHSAVVPHSSQQSLQAAVE